MIAPEAYRQLIEQLNQTQTTLIAVSKLKPSGDIRRLYDLGQRDFGENYVQEMVEKHSQLPEDLNWHFIGHLQSNKVKYIAPFVHLIHGIDSFKLLAEVNKQGIKNNRIIDCLLQVYIAQEETKFGLDENELMELLEYYSAQKTTMTHVRIRGLMGMASFSENPDLIRSEFKQLHTRFEWTRRSYFIDNPGFDILSAGMSNDYQQAIEAGSNMVRIGSLLFGNRNQ